MTTHYHDTPIGTFTGYLWINKPDTKFKPGGEYKAALLLRGKPARELKALVDAEIEAAFAAYMAEKKFTPQERKAWGRYCPCELETDADGKPTGAITFQFRQNATLVVRRTEEKIPISILIYDSAGKEMQSQVYGDSEGRFRFSFRPAPQLSNKKVGVRLDFVAVQITKLAERKGGPGGFAPVPGGYVENEADPVKEREAAARRALGRSPRRRTMASDIAGAPGRVWL